MAVKISGAQPKSLAYRKGIRGGETLLSVNGHEIMDVLDYQFYINDKKLQLDIRNEKGKAREIHIRKNEFEDIGLTFDSYLMDKQHHCKNHCIFCFIDQLPKGLRESLYFKDDDSRLSFLFGNYITLTNITEHEIERIIDMHISPINISVHTTNPELRVKMMRNPNAGKSLSILKRIASAGIKINTQLVLCPGINDGDELRKSLNDLGALYPSIQSIAAVPVGLTKYREGLYPLEPFDEKSAASVVDIIEEFGNNSIDRCGRRVAYPADEFYLKAKRRVPEAEFYGDFDQLENGVGLWAYLRSDFMKTLVTFEAPDKKRNISVATGTAAFPLITELVDAVNKKWYNLHINVYAIKNVFFGEKINIAGLVTGGDLIGQLKSKELGEELLIPAVMLRREGDIFLDDVTLDDVSKKLNVPVRPVPNDGGALLKAILGV